jgi:hypothetical protein
MVIVATVMVGIFAAPQCETFSGALGSSVGFGFERVFGHGGLIFIFLFPAVIVFALFFGIGAPVLTPL